MPDVPIASRDRLLRSALAWSVLAACCFGLRFALPAALIERFYSRGVYPWVRGGLDAVFGWWPVAASGLWLLAALGWFGFDAWRQARRGQTAYAKTGRGLLSVARTLSAVGVAFMLLWGYNYGRTAVPDQLGLTPRTLSTEELWAELERVAEHVAILRAGLAVGDAGDFSGLPLARHTPQRVREAVLAALADVSYPAPGEVRLRRVPAGGLLSFNTSGVYFPLTGEAHVDAGLHVLQMPFTMAHELLHGYGVTDEGECNFLAWLSVTRADNLYLRYSGHLTYYRYLGAAVRRRDPEGYRAFRQTLSRGVRADLDSISANNARYREIAPRVRHAVYDGYLRSQGVRDGTASYSRVIDLIAAWRNGPRRPRAVPTAGS